MIPVTFGYNVKTLNTIEQTLISFDRDNIIYVDDDNTQGPWDGTIDHPYQYIQDGIDAATDGETVFVFNGHYIESVVIEKTVNLVGEDN